MDILEWIDVGMISAERDDLLSGYFYDNGVLARRYRKAALYFWFLAGKGPVRQPYLSI